MLPFLDLNGFFCFSVYVGTFYFHPLLTGQMKNLSRRQKCGEKHPDKRRLANRRVSVGEPCVHPVRGRPAGPRLLHHQPVNPVHSLFIACGITSLHQNLHHHLLHGNSGCHGYPLVTQWQGLFPPVSPHRLEPVSKAAL